MWQVTLYWDNEKNYDDDKFSAYAEHQKHQAQLPHITAANLLITFSSKLLATLLLIA